MTNAMLNMKGKQETENFGKNNICTKKHKIRNINFFNESS